MSVNVDVGAGEGRDEVAALRRERDRYAALCAALRAERAAQNELVSRLEAEAAQLRGPREAATSIDAAPASLRVDGGSEVATYRQTITDLSSRFDGLRALREREEETFRQYRTDTEVTIEALAAELSRHGQTIGSLTNEVDAARSVARQQEQLRATSFAALEQKVASLETQLSARAIERQEMGSMLSVLRSESKSSSANLEKIKLDAVRTRMALTEANAQIERLRQQLIAANQQVLRTKNTLSFQLGHALIFSTKSWSGFCALRSWTCAGRSGDG